MRVGRIGHNTLRFSHTCTLANSDNQVLSDRSIWYDVKSSLLLLLLWSTLPVIYLTCERERERERERLTSSVPDAMEPNVEFTLLNLRVYSDGTVHRAPYDPPSLPACPSPSSPHQVATADVTLNESRGTSLRLYKPPFPHRLPLLLYFHGGGFLYGSSSLPPDHSFLCKLAAHSRSLIVSVDYRLAPEHPLPAAYDDGIEALLWLHKSSSLGEHAPHEWLTRYADFSNCFVGGDSAGANIAHHVAMWMATGVGFESASLDLAASWCMTKVATLEGLCVRGVILIHPFFTCGAETISERERKIWKFAGVSTEHPFANPFCASTPSLADAALPPRSLVAVASKDVYAARGLAYHRELVEAGKEAKLFISQDEEHVFHLYQVDSKNVLLFLDELRDFINNPLNELGNAAEM